MWDTIVLGSGHSGMCAAAALARCGERVLILEGHGAAGGQARGFERGDWHFGPGLQGVSGVGADRGAAGQFGRVLHWLSDGALTFSDCGNPADVVRLPGIEFAVEHPRVVYRDALLRRFPSEQNAIARWFDDLDVAARSARSLLVNRGLPTLLAWGFRTWRGDDRHDLSRLLLTEALARIVDPQLRAILGARWCDHDAAPFGSTLLEHALVEGAYDSGTWFPVGGAGRFLDALQPVVEAAGGELRSGARVGQILVTEGRINGVVFTQGAAQYTEHARQVLSTIGVDETVACLDKPHAALWQETVRALHPGMSSITLHLGFDCDVAAAGATRANVWICERAEVGRVWEAPAEEDAPSLVVGFPSLKDPAHVGKHVAEVTAVCDASAIAHWPVPQATVGSDGARTLPCGSTPAIVEARLLTQFRRQFPDMAAAIRFHELSMPITRRQYACPPEGSAYGIEIGVKRIGATALDVHTPVAGLLLAGQDLAGPGVEASCMSGLTAAAAIRPSLLRRLGL